MTEKFTRWDPAQYMSDSADMLAYLEACVAEDPGDGKLIQEALGDIARARSMSELARKTGMSREGLYKALSSEGNPSFSTILKVTRALGLELKPVSAPGDDAA